MIPSLFFVTILFLFNNLSDSNAESNDDSNSTLRLLHVLFRHGDRSPITLYNNDPNKDHDWPEGLGELSIIGKQQHYELGTFLRSKYKNFLTGNPREVSARSSGINRCLMSANCHLASLYSPSNDWVWNQNLMWQPIPVQTVPFQEDGLLNPSSICPKASEEEKRIINSPEGQKFIEDYKELFKYMTNNSGSKVNDWIDASDVYDTMQIERYYNLTIPEWAISVWDQMAYVHDMSFYLSFSTPLMQRLRAGLFLKDLKKHTTDARDAMNQNKKLEYKLYLYSSHDTQVAAVLNALQVFDKTAPHYCATLIFELHQRPSGYAIRLFYLNSLTPRIEPQTPQLLILPDCAEYCPLDKFETMVGSLLPEDWKKECGITQPEFSQTSIILISLLAIALAFVTTLGSFLMCRYSGLGARINYQLLHRGVN